MDKIDYINYKHCGRINPSICKHELIKYKDFRISDFSIFQFSFCDIDFIAEVFNINLPVEFQCMEIVRDNIFTNVSMNETIINILDLYLFNNNRNEFFTKENHLLDLYICLIAKETANNMLNNINMIKCKTDEEKKFLANRFAKFVNTGTINLLNTVNSTLLNVFINNRKKLDMLYYLASYYLTEAEPENQIKNLSKKYMEITL